MSYIKSKYSPVKLTLVGQETRGYDDRGCRKSFKRLWDLGTLMDTITLFKNVEFGYEGNKAKLQQSAVKVCIMTCARTVIFYVSP